MGRNPHEGVRHEIDLHVTIRTARGYDAVFVFECKNWKDPVGKKEVVVFSEKIDVARAQRGFFVATHLTKDAVAQAKKDPRIEVWSATAEELRAVQEIAFFHVLAIEYGDTCVSLQERSISPEESGERAIDHENATVLVDSVATGFQQYVFAWRDDEQNKRMARFGASEDLPAGAYPFKLEAKREFAPGGFVVSGVDYATAAIAFDFVARIIRPGIRARVQVDGRGGALQLEPTTVGGGELEIWLTSTSRKVE